MGTAPHRRRSDEAAGNESASGRSGSYSASRPVPAPDHLYADRPRPDQQTNVYELLFPRLTDASYVADFEHTIDYMLSATIYVNKDGILNDDEYDYASIGTPFVYQLGQTIYQHELGRKRKNAPDLSAFRIDFRRDRTGVPARSCVSIRVSNTIRR